MLKEPWTAFPIRLLCFVNLAMEGSLTRMIFASDGR